MAGGNVALDLSGTLVPMGQMRVTSTGEVLGTRALGSCVAVILRDEKAKAAGLAHCMLPLSQIDATTAEVEPCTFTDSGIAALREALLKAGARPDQLRAALVGGASLLGDAPALAMGKRNLQVARMLLEQFDIEVAGEAAGGNLPRSLSFDSASGCVDVFCAGRYERLGV